MSLTLNTCKISVVFVRFVNSQEMKVSINHILGLTPMMPLCTPRTNCCGI